MYIFQFNFWHKKSKLKVNISIIIFLHFLQSITFPVSNPCNLYNNILILKNLSFTWSWRWRGLDCPFYWLKIRHDPTDYFSWPNPKHPVNITQSIHRKHYHMVINELGYKAAMYCLRLSYRVILGIKFGFAHTRYFWHFPLPTEGNFRSNYNLQNWSSGSEADSLNIAFSIFCYYLYLETHCIRTRDVNTNKSLYIHCL